MEGPKSLSVLVFFVFCGCCLCGCCFSRQSWIMIHLTKMPPHGELFERREERCCSVETGPIAGCLGTSQGSIQAEWQPCTWLKVTATSGRLGHYFPTHSPRCEGAWSDRPQSALHYHLATPQVAAGWGKNSQATRGEMNRRGKIKVLNAGCVCKSVSVCIRLPVFFNPVVNAGRQMRFGASHKGPGQVEKRKSITTKCSQR